MANLKHSLHSYFKTPIFSLEKNFICFSGNLYGKIAISYPMKPSLISAEYVVILFSFFDAFFLLESTLDCKNVSCRWYMTFTLCRSKITYSKSFSCREQWRHYYRAIHFQLIHFIRQILIDILRNFQSIHNDVWQFKEQGNGHILERWGEFCYVPWLYVCWLISISE